MSNPQAFSNVAISVFCLLFFVLTKEHHRYFIKMAGFVSAFKNGTFIIDKYSLLHKHQRKVGKIQMKHDGTCKNKFMKTSRVLFPFLSAFFVNYLCVNMPLLCLVLYK